MIICHRGYFKDNSIRGVLQALMMGHGAEFDLRDGAHSLEIRHDAFSGRGLSCYFTGLLELIEREDLVNTPGLLAINIKSAGLAAPLEQLTHEFPWLAKKAFYFDLNGPDLVEYVKRGLPAFDRISDVEHPTNLDVGGYVWDDFGQFEVMRESARELVTAMKREGKVIVQIGPDLWQRSIAPSPLADHVITSTYPRRGV